MSFVVGAVIVGVLLLVLLGVGGCKTSGAASKTSATNIPSSAPRTFTPVSAAGSRDPGCNFDAVERMGADEGDNQCSPVLQEGTGEGLWLNAAPRVALRAPPPGLPHPTAINFTVCGRWRLTELSRAQFVGRGQVTPAIKLVAVDRDSGQAYVASWYDELGGTPARRPESGDGPAPDPASIQGGYFNVNLAHFMALPAAPGRYLVYAALGPFRSAPVAVDVEQPAPPLQSGAAAAAGEPRTAESATEVPIHAQIERAPALTADSITLAGAHTVKDQPGLTVIATIPAAMAAQVSSLVVVVTGPRLATATPLRGSAVAGGGAAVQVRIQVGGPTTLAGSPAPLPRGLYHLSVSIGEWISPTMSIAVEP